MNRLLHYILLTCSLLAMSAMPMSAAKAYPDADASAEAQRKDTNNSYHIDNDLYRYYKQIYQYRTQEKVLAMADTMLRRAIVKNDTRAQAYAINLPQYYYFLQKDDKKMEEVTERTRNFCLKHRIDDVYFASSVTYINYLLNNSHSYIALNFANGVQKSAEQLNSKYGHYMGLEATANIHFRRGEYSAAKQWYSKALEYAETYLPNKSTITANFRLAECNNFTEDYQDAIKYATHGIERTTDRNTQLRNRLEICIAYYYLGRKDDLMKLYDQISPEFGKLLYEKIRMYTVQAIYLTYMGRYDDAIKEAENIATMSIRNHVIEKIYTHKGDYKQALHYFNEYQAWKLEESYKLLQQDMADQEMLSGNYLLREKNQQMAISNAQLALANSNLELKSIKNRAEANRIKAEHNTLGLKKKQLETQNLKATIETKAIEQQKREAAEKSERMHMLIVTIGVVVLLVLLMMYLSFRIHMSRKLRASNKQLAVQNDELNKAREQADQANNMKTMFIQNMSHEIRTPLNAIVGFSQILAECSDDITEEEKHDFSNRIEQSSDLILNIINDILDLSSIESGHYKMQLGTANVNDMCRLAMVTVKERVPQGVELKFSSDVDDSYTIVTDSKRVVQVIINFLTNATKNTTEGSIHLHCSTSENEGFLSFSVADTGIGVAPEKMDVIFERFHKLDNLKQGAGLGLSICSIITDRLGGLIYIDKHYSGGARFVFAIPLSTHL